MCLFKYYEFECGCQIYQSGEFEFCAPYRRTGITPTTVLIPHTNKHDDIDRNIDGVFYQTMPQDKNLLFRWHFCKDLTYARATPKQPWSCFWHAADGVKEKCLRAMREESRMERERLEKEHEYERKKSRGKSQQPEKRAGKMGKGLFLGLVRRGGVSNE